MESSAKVRLTVFDRRVFVEGDTRWLPTIWQLQPVLVDATATVRWTGSPDRRETLGVGLDAPSDALAALAQMSG